MERERERERQRERSVDDRPHEIAYRFTRKIQNFKIIKFFIQHTRCPNIIVLAVSVWCRADGPIVIISEVLAEPISRKAILNFNKLKKKNNKYSY
jgi:hypothetical protein